MQTRFKSPRRMVHHAAAIFALIAALILPAAVLRAADADSPRERVSFNADWRFIKGDPSGTGDKLSYAALKPWLIATGPEFSSNAPPSKPPEVDPGLTVPYAQPDCDDTVRPGRASAENAWRAVNLPQDWGVEGAFNQSFPGPTGRLPWPGVGWYRKHFFIPDADSARRVSLEIDGAMAYAAVWLNGHFIGGWPYGYASFSLDLTPYLKSGAENVLAIRLDNPPNSSRWYPGGGIYRNVWLVKTAPVHVGHWGTYLTTPDVTTNSARVNIRVTVDNNSASDAEAQVVTEIHALAADNQPGPEILASTGPISLKIAANSSAAAAAGADVSHPVLWSLRHPARYVAITTVSQGGNIVDRYETPFGIRTIGFTADNGFLLNGERVPINGVCDHHDLGPLGSAINTRALERQIQLLQEMGCNAIRTSHNPPAPELLELCDRLGMLVMDESFDCWLKPKTPHDYHLLFADWHEKDLRAFIRRDRNHPCVILWSMGNEIEEQSYPEGVKIGAELHEIIHSEDPTRPVTSACNMVRSAFNGFQKNVDVFGYNYHPTMYGRAHDANPGLPIFGSETASCVSSRGEYFFPVSTNHLEGKHDTQMSSYDLFSPGWATPPDWEFEGQERYPFVAGEFVWTGFDYIGEPTPYGNANDTARSSYFGILDLCGFKKDRFYLYQAHWRPDFPMAHILPHWSWPGRAGQITPVHVYTSGDEAELFLNGKSLGRKKKEQYQYRLRWDDVVYEPGELKVVAYRNGKPWAEDAVKTTGPAAKIKAAPDRPAITADGSDLCYLTMTIADRKGLRVPQASNRLSFSVSGPGEIVGVDNGDPTSLEPFHSTDHNAFNGLCLVIVRSTHQPGRIVVKASSPGLKSARVTITALTQPR